MVLKNLFTGQQWKNRHREQTYGHGERGGEGKMYGKSNMETYITMCKIYAAAAAKSLQSCPTPSNPMDCSLSGSSVHGIFQARVLEWGAIAFSLSFLSYTANAHWLSILHMVM